MKNHLLEFTVIHRNKIWQNLSLSVVGQHNALNGLASAIVAKNVGLTDAQIKEGLLEFKGTKRRFEYIGRLQSGAYIYDDYAHHPTEIKTTLKAFSELYKNKKIVCIFQPHTYSRTKKLFDQFIDSFSDTDFLILVDIYASQREQNDPSISSQKLADAIQKKGKRVIYIPSFIDVIKYVDQQNYTNDYVIITMGAGDVYKVAEELII